MSSRQWIFVTAVGLALLALVLELIRRRMLREKYSLAWVFLCVGFLTAPWLYWAYAFVARLVGVVDPVSLFFFLAIVALFLLCVQFSLAVSTAYY